MGANGEPFAPLTRGGVPDVEISRGATHMNDNTSRSEHVVIPVSLAR